MEVGLSESLATVAVDATENSSNEDDADNVLNPTESKYKSLIKLKKIADDKNNPYQHLDIRRRDIYEDFYEQVKNAPPSLLEKAEKLKENLVEVRLEQSEKRLRSLLQFGEEMVTNIRAANERHEMERHYDELVHKADLQELITWESEEAIAQLEDIASRWFELDEIKEPLEMYEQMNEKKEELAEVFKEKDYIIAKCQKEIERINEIYTAELARQSNDIVLLAERVSAQTELMREAYEGQLKLLENSLEEERIRFREDFTRQYNEAYDELMASDAKKFAFVKEKQEYYQMELQRTTIEQEEITRATFIYLEKETDALDRELKETRNNVMLVSEKLDYNYQVLQKRNDENIVINNQQKRRIAQKNLTNLAIRKKLIECKSEHIAAQIKIQTQLKKLHVTITDLESKSINIRMLNKQKFDKLWAINAKDVKDVLISVFEIDRVLTEQHLAIQWRYPQVDFTDIISTDKTSMDDEDNEINIKDPFPSKKIAKKHKRSLLTKAEIEQNENEMRLMRNIFRRLANRTEFLLEDSIIKIIKDYTEDDRKLVNLNNVFLCLRLYDMEQIKILAGFLKPYTYCPNCQNGFTEDAIERLYSPEANSIESLNINDQKIEQKDCKDHYFVMEPIFVLSALNDYTEYVINKKSKTEKVNKEERRKSLELKHITMSDDKIINYFQKFFNYMPATKQKIWNVMEHGMNHFVVVLRRRQKLHEDCIKYRKQNQELKFLLQKITKVN